MTSGHEGGLIVEDHSKLPPAPPALDFSAYHLSKSSWETTLNTPFMEACPLPHNWAQVML